MITYTSKELVSMVPGVSYRQLDYWCRVGLFGGDTQNLGSGKRRAFTDADLAVLRAIAQVSGDLDCIGQRRNPLGTDIYRLIAMQVRDGATQVVVRLGERSRIVVDLEDHGLAMPA